MEGLGKTAGGLEAVAAAAGPIVAAAAGERGSAGSIVGLMYLHLENE